MHAIIYSTLGHSFTLRKLFREPSSMSHLKAGTLNPIYESESAKPRAAGLGPLKSKVVESAQQVKSRANGKALTSGQKR